MDPYDDLDPLTLAVRDLIGSSRRLAGRMSTRLRVGVNDMAAVGELLQHGPMGVAELAERLGIRSASATVLVDRLEAAGQVRRVPHATDRRRVTVTATPGAAEQSYRAWASTISAIDTACRALPERDRLMVQRFLRDLVEVVDGHPETD